MPPDTARPLRADAQRNRERILAAAQAEFARCGGEAQIDTIAALAGVGVGTVYRHFPTKDALVVELIRMRFEAFVELVERALLVADPWEAFASFMHANAALCASDIGTQWVFQAIEGEACARLAVETGLIERGQLLIDRGIAAGVIRPDFRSEDVGMIMCGVASAMHHGDPGWSWERHLGFVLDGLRVRPA